MKCVEVEKEIAKAPDGNFSDAVQAHLLQCPQCQEYAAFACRMWSHPAPDPASVPSLATIRHRLVLRRRWLVAKVAMIAVVAIGAVAMFYPQRQEPLLPAGEVQLSWDEWNSALAELELKIQSETGMENWQIQIADTIR